MGFFSWKCEICGHSLLGDGAITKTNAWMNKVVFVEKNGVYVGSYDGYGRVDTPDEEYEYSAPQCYHKKCWELAGRPDEYVKESQSASDQGWFFDEDKHNLPEPKTLEEAGDYNDRE